MSDIHPEKNLLVQGANVLTLVKNNQRYAMTFAWGMAIDSNKLIAMIGSQSDTSHALEIGDKIGISALAPNQKEIALRYGDGHSKTKNKFKEDELETIDGVLLIKNAARELVCKVVEIFFTKDNPDDPIVEFEVLKFKSNNERFINYIDLK